MAASVVTSVHAQVISVSDDFNDGNDLGWVHYAPIATPPFNAPASWTFPSDGSGGFGYRIYGGPPQDTTGGPTRVGAFRNDAAYSDFFQATDVLTFDATQPESAGFLAGRITTPGFLTTRGYLVGYVHQAVNASQSAFATVGFDSELTIFYPDYYTGGIAPMPNLDPNRRYRMTFSGDGPVLKGAIYDRTDLIEPVVRIASFDQMFSSGNLGIGVLNLNDTRSADFTYDNYYSMGSADGPIGFPGVAQVSELVPGPNALFYSPTGGVTFRVKTFSTTQIASNSIRLAINGSNVTSQLVITDATTLFEPARTHYLVRYSGALPSNTIVQAQIIANDATGKGTTNNWTFDTFSTNGARIIEAEDYNFSSGLFIEDPPVSGVASNGSIVSGGYYGLVGTPGVDFSDTRTSSNTNENQYRPDFVGTSQDRRHIRDTPRADHLAAEVGDYQVWQMQSGEWLNYTRTFSNARFNVYVRASTQAARKLRLDEVTSSASTAPQSTAIRGLFNVPNTGSSTRFRYVPLGDAFGNPQVLSLGGVRTLRLTALAANDDVQLNYILLVPASATARPAWVASVAPAPNANNADPQQEIEAVILNADTTVVSSTIQMRLDGSNVTSLISKTSPTSDGPGVTVRFRPGVLVPNSVHTVELVFADSNNAFQTNQWSFTVMNMVTLPEYISRAVPAGPRGFNGRIHKARNDAPGSDFPNNFTRAEAQLAGTLIDPATSQPYVNEAAGANGDGTFLEVDTINYEQAGNFAGLFSSDRAFPNIDPASYGGDPQNIAMAVTAYLRLHAGPYRFGVRSDDGFKLTAGFNAASQDLFLGGFNDGRPSESTEFDFFVSKPGLYGFRLLYFEGAGGADVEWYSVNRDTGQRSLVNASDGIPAYRGAGFRITDIIRTPTNIVLTFHTAPAHGYLIEYKTNLNSATWLPLTNGVASSLSTTVTSPGTNNARFFRLRVD